MYAYITCPPPPPPPILNIFLLHCVIMLLNISLEPIPEESLQFCHPPLPIPARVWAHLVPVRPHHYHWRHGSTALYVLQPRFECLQTFFPVPDVPEEQVDGAFGEEALVSCIVLLL